MKKEINNALELKDAIRGLKQREILQKRELTDNFHAFTESIKPINLIKKTFNKAVASPSLPSGLVKTAISLGVGMLSKRLLLGKSKSIFKRLAMNAVRLGVTGIISKKSQSIKHTGLSFLTKILGDKKKKS